MRGARRNRIGRHRGGIERLRARTRELGVVARLGLGRGEEADQDRADGAREGLERGDVEDVVEVDERLDKLAAEPARGAHQEADGDARPRLDEPGAGGDPGEATQGAAGYQSNQESTSKTRHSICNRSAHRRHTPSPLASPTSAPFHLTKRPTYRAAKQANTGLQPHGVGLFLRHICRGGAVLLCLVLAA